MKFVTNLFQGKPGSLEEGSAEYRPINEYFVLHRDETRTNCGKFVQIVKVILCIELIILVGWLGYVSFSSYNTDRSTDYGVSAVGCKSSKVVRDNVEVEHGRSVRSVEATEDEREKCERNANATRRALARLAEQFVIGEPSDPTVLQMRQNFTELTMYVATHVVIGFVAMEEFFMIYVPNPSFIGKRPDNDWHGLVQTLSERFFNTTNSQNRHRLNLHDSPTEEMANEFRDITTSLYVDARECDRRFTDSFPSLRQDNETDKTVQPSAEGGEGATPTSNQRSVEKRSLTADPVPKSIATKCWSEEEDKILAEERLERLADYAFRLKKRKAEVSFRKAFLRGIEAALNATSISEIHFEDDLRKSPWLSYVESLGKNSSLEVRKEGYALIRDLYLELCELKNYDPEWNGYNLDRIVDNLTAGIFFSVDFTEGPTFNDIVKYSNVFDLRYEELGNRESGAEPNKPMFGKFTYVGEKPETLGVRQLIHILDALVEFHFKTQDSSSMCRGETPTTGPVAETDNAKCWKAEHDPALLEERRERLEAYAIWNKDEDQHDFYMQKYLDAVEKALNATSASEIYDNNFLLTLIPELTLVKNSTMNSSLELYKDSLEIFRDMKLAFIELKEHTSKWDGLVVETILNNMTESIKAAPYKTGGNSETVTPEIISNNYNALGRPFNLRYEEIRDGAGGANKDKLVLGKFIYLGEVPEILGVRHFRHILNGGVRLYFKVRHPSIAPLCNSSAEDARNTNTV